MLQHGVHLFTSYARKPFQELSDSGSAFKVLKKRRYWDSSTSERPSPADSPRMSFDRTAIGPIQHLFVFVPLPF